MKMFLCSPLFLLRCLAQLIWCTPFFVYIHLFCGLSKRKVDPDMWSSALLDHADGGNHQPQANPHYKQEVEPSIQLSRFIAYRIRSSSLSIGFVGRQRFSSTSPGCVRAFGRRVGLALLVSLSCWCLLPGAILVACRCLVLATITAIRVPILSLRSCFRMLTVDNLYLLRKLVVRCKLRSISGSTHCRRRGTDLCDWR